MIQFCKFLTWNLVAGLKVACGSYSIQVDLWCKLASFEASGSQVRELQNTIAPFVSYTASPNLTVEFCSEDHVGKQIRR